MVRKTTPGASAHLQSRRAASRPDMPGIEMSTTTRSGWSLFTASSRASPFVTMSRISNVGSRSERISSKTAGWSSARMMLAFAKFVLS